MDHVDKFLQDTVRSFRSKTTSVVVLAVVARKQVLPNDDTRTGDYRFLTPLNINTARLILDKDDIDKFQHLQYLKPSTEPQILRAPDFRGAQVNMTTTTTEPVPSRPVQLFCVLSEVGEFLADLAMSNQHALAHFVVLLVQDNCEKNETIPAQFSVQEMFRILTKVQVEKDRSYAPCNPRAFDSHKGEAKTTSVRLNPDLKKSPDRLVTYVSREEVW
mgnify:CR=1 FL=1